MTHDLHPCLNASCTRGWHRRDSLYCSWRCEHIVEARMSRRLAARLRPGATGTASRPAVPAPSLAPRVSKRGLSETPGSVPTAGPGSSSLGWDSWGKGYEIGDASPPSAAVVVAHGTALRGRSSFSGSGGRPPQVVRPEPAGGQVPRASSASACADYPTSASGQVALGHVVAALAHDCLRGLGWAGPGSSVLGGVVVARRQEDGTWLCECGQTYPTDLALYEHRRCDHPNP